ncbi:hypothetical protein ACFPRL_11230 [Pseudoclavibacter helvolus]
MRAAPPSVGTASLTRSSRRARPAAGHPRRTPRSSCAASTESRGCRRCLVRA